MQTKLSYARTIVNSCINIQTVQAAVRQKIFVTVVSWWSYFAVWLHNHSRNVFMVVLLLKCKEKNHVT